MINCYSEHKHQSSCMHLAPLVKATAEDNFLVSRHDLPCMSRGTSGVALMCAVSFKALPLACHAPVGAWPLAVH